MHDRNMLQFLMANALGAYRDRVFAKFPDREATYLDVHRASNRVAQAIGQAGFGPGDRVAYVLPNSFELVAIAYGVFKSGATLSAMNMMVGDQDIAFVLQDAGVKLLFAHHSLLERVLKIAEGCPELKTVVAVGADGGAGFIGFEEFVRNRSEETPPLTAKPDDEALIVYTGGTTGRPKGVVHTQSGFYFDMLAHAAGLDWARGDVVLLMTPLSHAAGCIMFAGSLKGAKFIIENKFDPFLALDLIEKERVTKTFLVPTIIYLLLDIMKAKDYDLSSLNTVLYGAAPIAAGRLAEAMDKFGPVLVQKYGQVECPNMICTLTIDDHLRALKEPDILRSCGRPDLMLSMRIAGDKGLELPVGQIGEIQVKSPYVMKGYLNQPKQTAEVLSPDGWLATGDMGRVDENGYVYIVDRKKEMIISGGMNVYPAEVESVIAGHPQVGMTAVIGVPDEKWGEAVTAFVVPNGDVTEEELIDFCRDKLAKYARPKKVVIQPQLPLTLLGKVDKKTLRAPFWEGRERAV